MPSRIEWRFKLIRSAKLQEFIVAFPRDTRFKVTEDTTSSWIEIDVFGKYGWVQFAIWKATDELYALDAHGAAGDDPIAVRSAVRRTDLIPKHRKDA